MKFNYLCILMFVLLICLVPIVNAVSLPNWTYSINVSVPNVGDDVNFSMTASVEGGANISGYIFSYWGNYSITTGGGSSPAPNSGVTLDPNCSLSYHWCDDFEDGSVNWSKWAETGSGGGTESDGWFNLNTGAGVTDLTFVNASSDFITASTEDWVMEIKLQSTQVGEPYIWMDDDVVTPDWNGLWNIDMDGANNDYPHATPPGANIGGTLASGENISVVVSYDASINDLNYTLYREGLSVLGSINTTVDLDLTEMVFVFMPLGTVVMKAAYVKLCVNTTNMSVCESISEPSITTNYTGWVNDTFVEGSPAVAPDLLPNRAPSYSDIIDNLDDYRLVMTNSTDPDKGTNTYITAVWFNDTDKIRYYRDGAGDYIKFNSTESMGTNSGNYTTYFEFMSNTSSKTASAYYGDASSFASVLSSDWNGNDWKFPNANNDGGTWTTEVWYYVYMTYDTDNNKVGVYVQNTSFANVYNRTGDAAISNIEGTANGALFSLYGGDATAEAFYKNLLRWSGEPKDAPWANSAPVPSGAINFSLIKTMPNQTRYNWTVWINDTSRNWSNTSLEYIEIGVLSIDNMNVTSGNVFSENSAIWATSPMDFINFSNNTMSYTFTSTDYANHTAVVDQRLDYNAAIAADVNYKAATTDALNHANVVYDNFSLGNHYLYISLIDRDGIDISNFEFNFSRPPTNTSISLNSGISFGFIPDEPDQKCVNISGQNGTTPSFNITNFESSTINIFISLNAIVENITEMVNFVDSCESSLVFNTTEVNIFNLSSQESKGVWMYANYSFPSSGLNNTINYRGELG